MPCYKAEGTRRQRCGSCASWLKRQGVTPRVMVTDKLRSYAAAQAELMPGVEHRSHKGLNNRAENSHLPLRRRERRMMRFKSARQCQRFVSVHGQVANLLHLHRKHLTAPIIANSAPKPSPPGVKSHCRLTLEKPTVPPFRSWLPCFH
jgi:hypothetical protein